jgi:hypothetical protein
MEAGQKFAGVLDSTIARCLNILPGSQYKSFLIPGAGALAARPHDFRHVELSDAVNCEPTY